MGKRWGLAAVTALVGMLVLAGCGTAETPAATSGGGGSAAATVATVSSGTPGTGNLATAPASPVASPPAITPGTNGLTVTLADDGRTVLLPVGGRFLLQLGTDFDWTVNVADPSVVSRVPNVLVVRGAQGIYQARAVGTTTLTASGDPPCRKATPPCAVASRLFRITVAVGTPSATPAP